MSTPPAKIILVIWKMATNDKEKIREFSDLRRLQLPTRLEISNFRSDVDTSTSTDSISQNLGNVNPSGENISRTSGQRASTTTFQCRLLSCCRPLNSLKAPAITEALLRYFFNTQDNASFTLHIQYMRHSNFCQYLFAKNRPRFYRFTTAFWQLELPYILAMCSNCMKTPTIAYSTIL